MDDMFSFIDPLINTTGDDMFHSLAQLLEEYFYVAGDDAVADLPVNLPEKTRVEVPLDIALSMLRPDEREKLKNYVVSYLAKHNSGEGK